MILGYVKLTVKTNHHISGKLDGLMEYVFLENKKEGLSIIMTSRILLKEDSGMGKMAHQVKVLCCQA